ncbi:MAG TPA: hypothetical protein VJJ46_07255 [Anaerolineales bacterium]|nr:hypothetical protein [Anaerolineales bacterium]
MRPGFDRDRTAVGTKKPVALELYTPTHRVLGLVFPGPGGLFSYMNLRTESYVELENAEFCPLHRFPEGVERTGRTWMVKSEIAAVLARSRGDLGAGGATRAGYTKPFPYGVRIQVGGYEVEGMLESGGRFDFGVLMFEGDAQFISLQNTRLAAILFPRVQASAPALLFNRAMVTALTMLPSEPPP